MALLILGAIWFVITTIVGALMYASQVGPDQAVSNLSQWAIKFGIDNPPEWLKAKSADRLVRRRGAIALAALLVIGGFLGGMAADDYLRPATGSVPTQDYVSNRWEPLTNDEALALRAEFKKLPRAHLSVLCAYAGCADLADNIFTVVHDLNWSGTFEGGYLTDGGIKPGIEIWSYRQTADARNSIADAIERATKGRLKVSPHEWEGRPMPEHASDINLVIGRRR